MTSTPDLVRGANHLVALFGDELPLHAFAGLISGSRGLVERLVEREIMANRVLK